MDTRRTLRAFTWPLAIVGIVVSAYLPPGPRETSPTGVTAERTIRPKVLGSSQSTLSSATAPDIEGVLLGTRDLIPGTGSYYYEDSAKPLD